METLQYSGQGGALEEVEITSEALEAGARAFSEWRSLSGEEDLGSYELVRRVVRAVLGASWKSPSASM